MKKFILLLTTALLALSVCACSDNSKTYEDFAPLSEAETSENNPEAQEEIEEISSTSNAPVSAEKVEFLGETYLVKDADEVGFSEDGERITLIMFDDAAFVDLYFVEDEAFFRNLGFYGDYSGAKKVLLGDEINGLKVTEARMGFLLFTNFEPTLENYIILEGEITLDGCLKKHYEGEAPEDYTVSFSVNDTTSQNHLGLIIDKDNLEEVYPDIFNASDKVDVKATFSRLCFIDTDRGTGGYYAKLESAQLVTAQIDFGVPAYNSFEFNSTTELTTAISSGILDIYPIGEIVNYIEEEQNDNGLFAKTISNIKDGALYIPIYREKEIQYRDLDGFSNIVLLPCELYKNPWIWYYPNEKQSGLTRVSIMYLDGGLSAGSDDISKVISEIDPEAPNVDNIADYPYYSALYVSEIQLSGRTVNALIAELKDSEEKNAFFVYDDVLVLITISDEETALDYLKDFSF